VRRLVFFSLFLAASSAFAVELFPEEGPVQPRPIPVQRIAASSYQQPDPNNPRQTLFDYRWAIDGDITQSWGTGRPFVPGQDWIQLFFDEPVLLTGMSLANGLQGKGQPPSTLYRFYRENGRVKRATLLFSDGSEQEVSFRDKMGFQDVRFRPVRARWVRMRVEEIYPGSQEELTKDFGLAEMIFYGIDERPLLPVESPLP
jgi:hypothetical protein